MKNLLLFISFLFLFSVSLSAQENSKEENRAKAINDSIRIVLSQKIKVKDFEGMIFPVGLAPYTRDNEKKLSADFTPVVVSDYFLLGLLLKNAGFQNYDSQKLNENNIAQFSLEDPLANYTKTNIEKYWGVKVEFKKAEPGGFFLYSEEAANKLKPYFDKDGNFKWDLLNTTEKISSFILGIYSTRGYKVRESIYFISFDSEELYHLLYKIECGKIFYKKNKYMSNIAVKYYFEPSVSLEKYFDTISEEKEKLDSLRFDYEASRFGKALEETEKTRNRKARIIETIFDDNW